MGMMVSAGADGTLALQRKAISMNVISSLYMMNMTLRCVFCSPVVDEAVRAAVSSQTRSVHLSVSLALLQSLSPSLSLPGLARLRRVLYSECVHCQWFCMNYISRHCVLFQCLPGSCCWGNRRRVPSPHSTVRKRRVKRLLTKVRVQRSCPTRYCWAATHTHTHIRHKSSHIYTIQIPC